MSPAITRFDGTDADSTDLELNSVETAAEEHVSSDEAEGQALQETEPLLCPPVCLGYAAGAFVVGYGATKSVGSSADTAEDGSALTAFLNETDVEQDASVDELVELRERA